MRQVGGASVAAGSERVLLIRPGALGDTLLLVPALAALRASRSIASIGLIARRDVLPILRASSLVDSMLPYDDPRIAWLFGAVGATAPHAALKEITAGARVVAWVQQTPDNVAANLTALGARGVQIADAKPLPSATEHMALTLLGALRPLGIRVPRTLDALIARLPALTIPPNDEEMAASIWRHLGLAGEKPVVALHPGSGGASKRWPAEAWAELIGHMSDRSTLPVLIEGPQDADAVAEIGAKVRGMERLAVAREMTVGATLALLRRCKAYVGNDSGVSHLAALGGVPTLALFGPTDTAIWEPVGKRVRVLIASSGRMAEISPEEVMRVLGKLVTWPVA